MTEKDPLKNQLAVLIAQMNESGIEYAEAVREFKKSFITHVLLGNKSNQCRAARQLGMHRNTLSRTLAELGLNVRELRRGQSGDASAGERRPPRSVAPPPEKKAVR